MRRPIYETVVAACKVGCFGCGATLDPGRAQFVPGKPHRRRVKCTSCDEVTEFDLSVKEKGLKPEASNIKRTK
jgi:hypothetical protein